MSKTALLVIDVQKGLDDPSLGRRNNPDAEANMARLIAAWREGQRPLIHIKHNSTEPNSPLRPKLPGNAFKDEARPLPGEKQFSKTVNSAFIGTGLTEYLHEQGIDSLVVVGLTTMWGLPSRWWPMPQRPMSVSATMAFTIPPKRFTKSIWSAWLANFARFVRQKTFWDVTDHGTKNNS